MSLSKINKVSWPFDTEQSCKKYIPGRDRSFCMQRRVSTQVTKCNGSLYKTSGYAYPGYTTYIVLMRETPAGLSIPALAPAPPYF